MVHFINNKNNTQSIIQFKFIKEHKYQYIKIGLFHFSENIFLKGIEFKITVSIGMLT